MIALLVHHVPVAVLGGRWGRSLSCISPWRHAFLLQGMASVPDHQGGGRRPQLTPRQKKRLGELIEAGPLVVGCETAWWTSVLIRVLLWREGGVLSHCQYGWTLLHNVGVSFPKARLVSEHLAAARRQHGLPPAWPTMLRAAERRKGLIRCEDEASVAQWGSLRDTWARRGQQPAVKTSGTRKGDKVFGAIAYFSGRLFDQGIEGRFPSARSQTCVQTILTPTQAHVLLIHAGARYHTSKAMEPCVTQHADRLMVAQLPSSSPDDNPIAYLWKTTTKRATPHQYCKACAALTVSVDKALAYFATHPDTVLRLFGLYCEASGLELTQAA